jgi:dihydroneopterin aldolase
MKIILKDIDLYGFHGVHELERKVGVNFMVDIVMQIEIMEKDLQLHDTIDYAVVFSILKTEFAIPTLLLESLAIKISEAIKIQFPKLLSISIKIMKIGAAIDGLQGKVGIEYDKSF